MANRLPRWRLAAASVLACASLLAPRAAWAQRTTGEIIGTVTDASASVLPGVTVTVRSQALQGTLAIVTSGTGRYQFTALPPGSYDIEFSLTGFTTAKREQVPVVVGTPTELNVVMAVGDVETTVTVRGDSAAIINPASSQVSSRLTEEWLRAAPVNRSYFELLRQGQGVNVATSTAATAFTVFGSGANDNQFLLDGADQTTSHAANTAPTVFPNLETLQEVQFLSLGAPAEYGSFMGGVFNAVTRQGSNAFHGDGAIFFQPEPLTARNTTPAQDSGFPFTRDRFHDASVQVGGPLRRDRLWFFGSYEHSDDFFSQVGVNPAYPTGTTLQRGLIKATAALGKAQRLTVSVNPNRYESVTAGSAFIDPLSINRGPQKGITPSAAWDATLSPTTLLEVRGNYYYSNYTAQPQAGQPEVKTRYVALDTGRTTGGVLLVGESKYKKVSASAKVTHYSDRFIGGSHDVRLGVQYSKGAADNNFYYNDLVYTIAGQPQNGYIQIQSEYGAHPSRTAVFTDDSYRPSNRVTIDVGLRYDYSHISSPAFPQYDRQRQPTGQSFPAVDDLVTWNTISPRAGITLKLDDDGRTVVKGHYGRYFQSPDVAAAFYRVLPSSSPRYAFSGRYDANGDPIGVIPISTASNRQMDDDLGAARTDQFVAGVERQVGALWGVSVYGVYKRGGHYTAWQDTGGQYDIVPYADTVGTDATGGLIPVFRLVSPSASRFFLLTDPDQMFSRYRGLTAAVNRRMAGHWELMSSLTWSTSTGRLVSSNSGPASAQNSAAIFSSFGQNPNDFVNSDRLLIADRPVLWKTQFIGRLPWRITAAVSHQLMTGRAWGRTIRVPNLGLTTTIRADPLDGSRRLDDLNLLDIRLEESVPIGGSAQLAVFGDVLNLLNGNAFESVASTLGTSAAFGSPTNVQVPRRLMLGARLRF
jgi:Carboxypeptidase regulatory-like domain/TonB dependent receptor-like, beta-barrel/TonB-dependent Receptor Plug Domain